MSPRPGPGDPLPPSILPTIIVVGPSARAATFSAIRAGFEPAACDLFGDADLRAAARFVDLRGEYPLGLVESVEQLPEAPLIYTGGLENHPDLVGELARRRPLWGNTGEVLRLARDPFLLAAALRGPGVEPPELRAEPDPPSDPRGWLRKPLAGAGGRGIAPASRRSAAGREARSYYQRRIRGGSYSSLHGATPRGCELLGVTRQLVGERWLHARPFAWCGTIGPTPLPRRVETALHAAGERAARALGLRGLFGIDFILDGEVIHPVELNPRYTASIEVLEHARGIHSLALHAEAFGAVPPAGSGTSRSLEGILGKAVVFAPRHLVLEQDILALHPADPWTLPVIADIPARGQRIPGGRPVLTVFASAKSDAECEGALRLAAAEALRRFRTAAHRVAP